MRKVLTYLPLHFVAFVILGILIQFYFQIWSYGFTKLGLIFAVLLGLLFVFKQAVLRTLLSFLLFFLLGVSSLFIDKKSNYNNYYLKNLSKESSVVLKINKVLKANDYHLKYEAKVIQVDSIKTRGKVLLNIYKDSLQNILNVDDLLFTKPVFSNIRKPANPHQFDYKFYLEKQDIYQQVFLKEQQFKQFKSSSFSIYGLSSMFRNKVQNSLANYQFKPNELAVINALLLGKRQDISEDLIQNYANAGAIHILAVSGLHVGIILLLLSILLKPLERLKRGKVLKTLIIVLLLWMFAFVAGLSASVVRAVTMFTFLAIGLSFNRKNVVLFSLISSMFFLLIFRPLFLFDVGFQLSYLAVFGIILIQPKLYNLWTPKYKIIDKFWQLSSVSIGAQIGILPLSLFYFHQFPGLFMLSNLVIIPFLGAILMGGIIIITLALLGVLPQFLASFYGAIIAAMNSFVSWVSGQEQFLFKEISLSFFLMLASYLVVIFGIQFLIKKSPKYFICFLQCVVVFQLVFLFETYKKQTKEEFIVIHKTRNTIIGYRFGEQFFINHDLDSSKIESTNALISYKINQNIKPTYQNGFSNVVKFKNNKILLVDSLGVYQVAHLNNPIVLLQQSPKINLERLINKIAPVKIIADGSNYKSYVKRWKITSEKLGIPFHDTNTEGAFILSN